MYHILTLNNIAPKGLNEFDRERYQIGNEINQPDAMLVRSYNLHDYVFPSSVQVVGRAGVGVNTIPIDRLTKAGIPVLNTPGANANAVKELVITGMLLASRNICPAWDYTRQIEGDDAVMSKQVEQYKKQFAGFELPGKTLAVIGLGNIGVAVANAALQLGMKVIGYDPAITVRHAWQLSSNVQQAEYLNESIKQADFITLHVPLNEHTKNLINVQCIQLMKPEAILLNLARNGIVDNQALIDALNQHKIRSYVCDFPTNLLKDHPQVICLPHLGASTKEAEENCAVMIAQQVQDYLEDGHIKHSVNFPEVKMPRTEGARLAIINTNVPNMVAQISKVLSDSNMNIIDMINKSREHIAYNLIDLNTAADENLLTQLKAIEGVIHARMVQPFSITQPQAAEIV